MEDFSNKTWTTDKLTVLYTQYCFVTMDYSGYDISTDPNNNYQSIKKLSTLRKIQNTILQQFINNKVYIYKKELIIWSIPVVIFGIQSGTSYTD